jgi:peptidyl-prolyl cis-trans isomerase C
MRTSLTLSLYRTAWLSASLLLATAALGGCADSATRVAADDAVDAVALVNGKPISRALFDTLVEVRQAGQETPLSDAQQQEILDELIVLEALAQQATAESLHLKPRIAGELEAQYKTTLAQWLVQDFLAEVDVTDDEVAARYEQTTGTMEYAVRHILLDDEPAAQAIIAQLQAGSDFAELAREHSVDTASAAEGGVLGWLSTDQVVEPFAQAMRELNTGEHSRTPVHSVFGWHVVRIDNRRELQRLELEEVRGWLYDELRHGKIQARIDAVRDGADVVRLLD